MDGGINRIERTGPQPAARARRAQAGEHEPFTLDSVEPRGDGEQQPEDDEHGDPGRDERPIAPRAEDESGGRIDLTA